MPYSIARGKGCSASKPWAVVKDTDGSVVACHASKETALAQIRALYAAEPALAKARANLQKHLAGKHDQASHAKGTGASSTQRQKKMTGEWGHSRTGSSMIATASRDLMGIDSRIDIAGAGLTDSQYGQARIALENISQRPILVDAPLVHLSTRMPEIQSAQIGSAVKLGLTATAVQESGSLRDSAYLDDDAIQHQVLIFKGTKPTHLYSGRRTAPEEALVAGEFKIVGKREENVPRQRLVNGAYQQFTSKATVIELEQVSTFDTTTSTFVPFNSPVTKHLPGQHSQQTHATGGGGASDTGAPKKRNKKDIAGDDQRALELYESGKTWDQVAQEMGFANGGVARRAGKRHEERRKAGETDDTKKPDETPDKPKPVEQPKPPEIVDVVTPPRPMDGKDPSQQLVPTNDLQEAMATGRPYAPLTYEGRTERARQAEERLIEVRREFNATQELHRGEIDRRYEVEQRKRAEYDAELDERLKASPKRAGESDWQHTDRVKSEMRAEGKKRSDKGEDEIRDDLINEGVFTPAEAQRLRKAEADIKDVWDETRYQMRVDTAEVLLGGKLSREPRMVPDFNSPADPVTGRPRMKQETRTEYPDGLRGEPRQAPVFDDVYVLPDGRQIKHNDVFPRGAYEDMPSDEYNIIRTTAKWRMGLVEQRATRQELIDGDGDGKFNEAMKKQLARQQAVVDSPNTRIVVHAPVTALGGITSAGFKSQLATGRSKGYKNRDEREGFETGLLGVVHPPDDKSRGLIYGALHTGGVRHADAVGAEQYGEIGFVLRREVHQRSTWTEGDSLGFHHEFAPLTGTQTVFNGGRIRGGVDAADTSQWGTSDDKFASDLSPTPRRSRGYREAQVHGGVSLADVEYVTIPKGTKIPETARKRLVKAGVKIVEYDPADASPGVDGTEMHYPKNGKPYEVPKYKDGDWGNLPLPSDKAFTFAVDLFKFRRRHINGKPLESLPVSTSWMNPTVMVKHLAGKHDQASHSGKRHGGYRLSDVDNPKADASVSQESRDAAKAVRDAAMAIEPGMTADMIDLANAHGGQMEGLAFRVKSEKSLARKVEAEKQDFGGDAMKTAESMSDVVRYTMSFDERQYTDGTQAVLDDLNAKGYKTRTKNYWQSDDPYQGINVAVTHPNGTVFELQFHTPKSVVEKEKVHLIYDNYRTEPSKKRRWQMWQEMVGISNAIPVPPGNLLGIGELRSQTFKSMWKRATQW